MFLNFRWWWESRVRIEIVPPDEEEAFLRVLCLGFGIDLESARHYYYNDPYFPHNQRWGLWLEDHIRSPLVSIATTVPIQFYLNGRVLRAYGVAGVTTLQQYRRQGYARQLLTEIIQTMHARDVPGLALQAFDHNFYRKLGWETVGTLARLRVKPSQLPRLSAQGVRRMTADDDEAVIQLYRQAEPTDTGRIVRNDLRWEYLLWNFRHKWVYERGGNIEGYLIFDFADDGMVLRIRELFWATESARLALIGWLASNEEQVRQIEFSGTLAELQPIVQHLMFTQSQSPDEPTATVEVVPGMMWRVTHPQAMLSTLLDGRHAPDGFQPFTIAVRDSLLRRAPILVGIRASGGVLQVDEGSESMPTAVLEPRGLAQLVWGSEDVPTLLARGALRASLPLVRHLEPLFPRQTVCLRPIDYF